MVDALTHIQIVVVGLFSGKFVGNDKSWPQISRSKEANNVTRDNHDHTCRCVQPNQTQHVCRDVMPHVHVSVLLLTMNMMTCDLFDDH